MKCAIVRKKPGVRSRLFSVSGRAIAELASTFTAANAENIARIQAGQIAERPLEEAVKNVQTALLLGDERVDDVMEVMKRAAQPVIDDPPMKTGATGHRVLDEEAFTNSSFAVWYNMNHALNASYRGLFRR